MTDTDEGLLTVAKLREVIKGDLDGGDSLYQHAGVVEDDRDRAALSFIEGAIQRTADDRDDQVLDDLAATSFDDTDLGSILSSKTETDAATRAVSQGNGSLAAHLVGITEQDLDGSALRLPMLLDDRLDAHGAPAFVVGAGNPNTGKTNTMSLLAELRNYTKDDLLILSNIRSWELTDIAVTSCYDLACQLIEHKDVPKFVLIDESSTHFDARTYRREVATQWTPLAKRFAKIGVDVVGNIVHTGKDLHPEAKRLCNLAYFKTEPTRAEFYERWPADEDYPVDQLYNGDVHELEPTGAEYDPDDSAPWKWDLPADLFAEDHDWPGLLDALRDHGPATN